MVKYQESVNLRIGTREAWIVERQKLLAKEKEMTRLRDQLSEQRLALPWVRVDKKYVFEEGDGLVALADLFGKRSQLAVYHFMFAPDWDAGCPGCSFVCDHLDSARQHFEHNDLSFVAVSRAPWPKLEAYRKRMGWTFRWVSSDESDFNYDFGASFKRADLDAGPVFYNFKLQKLNSEDQPGASFFYKDETGDIFHTYSVYERGLEPFVTAYDWLDAAPKGRKETGAMDWMQRHDEYKD